MFGAEHLLCHRAGSLALRADFGGIFWKSRSIPIFVKPRFCGKTSAYEIETATFCADVFGSIALGLLLEEGGGRQWWRRR